jgi:hypothetical protein
VMMAENQITTALQTDFMKSSIIRITDRQSNAAYIRLFDDLLNEPKKSWERK